MARIMGARTLLVFAVLFVVFLVLYKVLPNRKATFKSQLPGAFIIAMAWLIFSYGFSLYFEFFSEFRKYVWKPDCTDHGNAVAVCVYEPDSLRGRD